MKIKDIKGMADKLLGVVAQGYRTKDNEKKEMDSTLMYACQEAIFNTDIDLNDIVEIDVEKLREYLIIHHFSGLPDEAADGVEDFVDDIIEGVAKSGCIRWRSKKEGKE